MKDEVVIIDTNFDQMTGPRRADDNDITVEIMDGHGIVQGMVNVLSCEAVLPRTLQEPHDGNYICHTARRQPLLPTHEGRVQAERPTRTRPQRQGNGPEGERHTELDRSPRPGRRCHCGCPQQVDRLDHPLARGVARMAPGWLPTIMAGPAQPCPQPDDTHHKYPRRKSGDMDPPAGTLRSSVAPAAGRVALRLIRAISGGRM